MMNTLSGRWWAVLLLPLVCCPVMLRAKAIPTKKDSKTALQKFNHFIGSWRATGIPYGTAAERRRGFWTEKIRWQWQFKDKDTFLKADFTKGRYFTAAELRYLPARDRYQLTVHTVKKTKRTFEGTLKGRHLTLDYTDPKSKETQRLVISLLHSNRYLYRFETRSTDRTLFTRKYRVGATKEGVAFAKPGTNQPECVVSGGLGTMPVTYKGKTYYVCCSGCRDAFMDSPETFIKEYEARKKKAK